MPARNHSVKWRCFALPVCSSVVTLFVALSLATMLGCMGGGEPKHPTWKNATGAEQYERLMWQALRDKDWKEAEYRLAPTFVGVIANGQALDRTRWIAHWQAASIKEFSIGEVAVQPNKLDMTVAYQLHLVGAANADVQVISVWQEIKGGWVLTATSHTPIQK